VQAVAGTELCQAPHQQYQIAIAWSHPRQRGRSAPGSSSATNALVTSMQSRWRLPCHRSASSRRHFPESAASTDCTSESRGGL
jgi:hypothetical protein